MKFGIFTTNSSFIMPVMEELKRRGHETYFWTSTDNQNVNWINLTRILDWCDIAFIEWCQTPFFEIMSVEKKNCKVAVRAHGLPFFSIYNTFPWNTVDMVIGASQIIGWKLKELPPSQQPKRYLDASVGSDPAFYQLPKNKKYGKNMVTHSTTIRFRKRVYTTIQTFYDLLQQDRKWTLHIVGEWEQGYGPQWEGRQYTEPCRELMEDLEITTKIRLAKNMPLDEWRNYLADKDIFISNSIREGVQVSMVDAMLCGIYPLINLWRGAKEYYPQDCLFKTQRELVDKSLEWSKLLVKDKRRLSQEMREWACERFDVKTNTVRLVDELETL